MMHLPSSAQPFTPARRFVILRQFLEPGVRMFATIERRPQPLCALVLCLLTVPALGAEPATKTTPRRTPDLQGMWTGAILTPLERPKQFAEIAAFQQQEMGEQQRQATERFWAAGHRPGEVGRDNDAFLDGSMKILPDGRTSLISQPASGLVPLLPQAEKRRDFNLTSFDAPESMSQWDRCITREPLMMLPGAYNAAYQIVQTPTHVVIVAEMIHDARIIPLQGAHGDARIKSWGGDARGHWESNTLVVETRNFHGRGWMATAQTSGRLRGVPFSEQLRTTERFTPIDANTLEYRITVEDPQAFSAPWEVTFPLTRDESYRMYEYACHEGNTAVAAMMRGARAQEQAEAARQ
jgi:hypothetical protein